MKVVHTLINNFNVTIMLMLGSQKQMFFFKGTAFFSIQWIKTTFAFKTKYKITDVAKNQPEHPRQPQ